jgi:hypothetical protein
MSMVVGSRPPKLQRRSALGWLLEKWQAYCQDRKCGAEFRIGGKAAKTEG